MKPHWTADDRRLLTAMRIDLGDPRVTLREPDRLDTDRERYDNMKREAALVIGELSLQRADALRRLNIANGIAAALVVALAGTACAILVRLR